VPVLADRYEIISLLGRGGMGVVYRARHLGLGIEVAVKVLGRAGDAVRFEREARAIARLDHPGCVRVLDHGVWGRTHFIAMELLDGPTLDVAIGAGLSVPRALAITRRLLAALAHAHGHGVLHRDIKPANVILARRGPVLIDFGLARLHDEAARTAEGTCVGSPSYIAPERLAGAPYDARADLYAVGVLLYEMLAGVRPFGDGSPHEIMQRCLTRPPRPLRARCADLPEAVDAFVRRALAKDPARRFADADDMQSALADLEVEPPGDDGAAATTHIDLAIVRRSMWARVWAWLRFGAWRWEPSGSSR
jgi:serine/threonine-protein kinase